MYNRSSYIEAACIFKDVYIYSYKNYKMSHTLTHKYLVNTLMIKLYITIHYIIMLLFCMLNFIMNRFSVLIYLHTHNI